MTTTELNTTNTTDSESKPVKVNKPRHRAPRNRKPRVVKTVADKAYANHVAGKKHADTAYDKHVSGYKHP